MTRRFRHEEIAQWAEVSGDHNQVHFDREIARKNGLDDIIVQGMLVMIDAKMKLYPYLKPRSSVNFYLKNPVYVEESLDYRITPGTDKVTFKVVEEQQGRDRITGKLIYDSDPIFEQPRDRIDVNPEFFQEQIDLFRREYPHVTINWLVMDALLFSVCFKFQKGDPFFRKALKITKQPDKTKVVTYQTDQKVFVPERLLSDRPIDVSRLWVSYEDKDIIKEDYSVYSLLDYQVMEGDELLYQSSMGSITKGTV